MSRLFACLAGFLLAALFPARAGSPAVLRPLHLGSGAERDLPKFHMQEIESNLGIGYAVAVADLNGDRKPDLASVNEKEVLWYENPSWTRRVIVAEGQTPRDNVCIAAADLDGDRRAELALGAFWKPSDTQGSGSVHYLLRQGSPAQPWKLVNLEAEPTVHRMRWADVDGDARKELVVVPLQGRGTRGPDWLGNGARIQAYFRPGRPAVEPWRRVTLDESLHVVHGFWPTQWDRDPAEEILTASFEGAHLLDRQPDGTWKRLWLAEGDQESRRRPLRGHPRGCSEIKAGRLARGERFLATIEPWHGNAVVVYRETDDDGPSSIVNGPSSWSRQVLDDGLRGGHGIWCADLDGDGADEVIAGWREATSSRKVGLRIYRLTGGTWQPTPLDDGGMACEDLAAADLDGDRRIDVVASGRSTHNLRIYWNRP